MSFTEWELLICYFVGKPWDQPLGLCQCFIRAVMKWKDFLPSSLTAGVVPKKQELPLSTKYQYIIKDVNIKIFEKNSKRKTVDGFAHRYYKYSTLELEWFWVREMCACCQGLVFGVFSEILRRLCKVMFRWFFKVERYYLIWISVEYVEQVFNFFDNFIHVFKIFWSYLWYLFISFFNDPLSLIRILGLLA